MCQGRTLQAKYTHYIHAKTILKVRLALSRNGLVGFKHLWDRTLCVERTVSVLEEVGKVEELWDQLFDVIWIRHEETPHSTNRMKLPVGHVETGNEAVKTFHLKYKKNIHKTFEAKLKFSNRKILNQNPVKF